MDASPQKKPPAGTEPSKDEKPAPYPLELKDDKPRFHGCSRINEYEVLGKLGEGTFGEVHKARSKKTGNFVALKKVLMHNEKDGFPITALREIKLLKMLNHPNTLKLEEMAVEHRKTSSRKQKAAMYMVTPYMDHDLSGLLENPAVKITEPHIKCYMIQLLEGLKYLHGMQILHRDMKAANLLISNKGILQIADFGLARPYDDPPPQPGKGGGEATRDYTTLVVTRWYRPPELLLQLRKYTTAIDMWGVGCVFGEMFKGRPILAGKSDLNQIESIFELVGSPTEENMPGWSSLPGCEGVTSFSAHRNQLPIVFRAQGSAMISLITELLCLDWRKRINAMDALKHPYFTSKPLPSRPGDIPQFEESHELDRRKFRDQQAALPPAPAGGTVGMGPHQGEWGGANGYNGGGRRGPPPHQGQYSHPPPSHGPPPRNGFEGRLPHHQGGRDNRDNRDRRPPWQGGRDRDRDRPHEPRPHESSLPPRPHGLPPRPVDPASWAQGWAGEERGPPLPRHRQDRPPRGGPPGGGGGDVDTYIPDYSGGGARPERYADRPPRRDDRDRDRGGRDMGGRDERRRSRSPATRMRDQAKEVYGRR